MLILPQGKWETSGKKKKNRQTQQKTPEVNGHDPAPAEKEEKEPVENTNRRRDKQREGGYRYRGPPRMNRGGNQSRNCKLFLCFFKELFSIFLLILLTYL